MPAFQGIQFFIFFPFEIDKHFLSQPTLLPNLFVGKKNPKIMSYNTGSREPSLDWKFHAFPVLDVKAATEKLKAGEASYTFAGEVGIVSRCDTIQLASNPIIEDYMVSSSIDVGEDQKWHCWAVYDGHA